MQHPLGSSFPILSLAIVMQVAKHKLCAESAVRILQTKATQNCAHVIEDETDAACMQSKHAQAPQRADATYRAII